MRKETRVSQDESIDKGKYTYSTYQISRQLSKANSFTQLFHESTEETTLQPKVLKRSSTTFSNLINIKQLINHYTSNAREDRDNIGKHKFMFQILNEKALSRARALINRRNERNALYRRLDNVEENNKKMNCAGQYDWLKIPTRKGGLADKVKKYLVENYISNLPSSSSLLSSARKGTSVPQSRVRSPELVVKDSGSSFALKESNKSYDSVPKRIWGSTHRKLRSTSGRKREWCKRRKGELDCSHLSLQRFIKSLEREGECSEVVSEDSNKEEVSRGRYESINISIPTKIPSGNSSPLLGEGRLQRENSSYIQLQCPSARTTSLRERQNYSPGVISNSGNQFTARTTFRRPKSKGYYKNLLDGNITQRKPIRDYDLLQSLAEMNSHDQSKKSNHATQGKWSRQDEQFFHSYRNNCTTHFPTATKGRHGISKSYSDLSLIHLLGTIKKEEKFTKHVQLDRTKMNRNQIKHFINSSAILNKYLNKKDMQMKVDKVSKIKIEQIEDLISDQILQDYKFKLNNIRTKRTAYLQELTKTHNSLKLHKESENVAKKIKLERTKSLRKGVHMFSSYLKGLERNNVTVLGKDVKNDSFKLVQSFKERQRITEKHNINDSFGVKDMVFAKLKKPNSSRGDLIQKYAGGPNQISLDEDYELTNEKKPSDLSLSIYAALTFQKNIKMMLTKKRFKANAFVKGNESNLLTDSNTTTISQGCRTKHIITSMNTSMN